MAEKTGRACDHHKIVGVHFVPRVYLASHTGGGAQGRTLLGGGTAERDLLCVSIIRAPIAAREPTPSFAKIRRRYVHTVQELMFSTSAMTLLGCPCATMRTISCSRGLSCTRGRSDMGSRTKR